MVDTIDSKSIIGNYVWVQVPPPAPKTYLIELLIKFKGSNFFYVLCFNKMFQKFKK